MLFNSESFFKHNHLGIVLMMMYSIVQYVLVYERGEAKFSLGRVHAGISIDYCCLTASACPDKYLIASVIKHPDLWLVVLIQLFEHLYLIRKM